MKTKKAKKPARVARSAAPPEPEPDLNALLADEPQEQPPPDLLAYNPDRTNPLRPMSCPEGSRLDQTYNFYAFDANQDVGDNHLQSVAESLAAKRHPNIGELWLTIGRKLIGLGPPCQIDSFSVTHYDGPNTTALWVSKGGKLYQLGTLRPTGELYSWALKDGYHIIYTESHRPVPQPPHSMARNGPVADFEKGTTPTAPRAAGGTGKDRFGFRVGSEAAKINAVLTGEKKSPAAIKKEAGVERNVLPHLSRLVREGKLVRTKKGNYYVKGEKGEATPAPTDPEPAEEPRKEATGKKPTKKRK